MKAVIERRSQTVSAPAQAPRARATTARDVVILMNPASGRGRGEHAAKAVEHALQRDGHDVRLLSVREWDALTEACDDADALVICGGDGTVHHALELLIHERDEEAAERATRSAGMAARRNGSGRVRGPVGGAPARIEPPPSPRI